MFVAPLVAVAVIIAIPLWPVAVVLLAVLWLLASVGEQLCRLLRIPALRGAGATTWRWLTWMAKPLNWFDPPRKKAENETPKAP
jgi:hypothetical protein